MTFRSPRQRFILTLMPDHRDNDPTGFYRLKAVLKRLLRQYGLRCREISYPDAPQNQLKLDVTGESAPLDNENPGNQSD